MLTDRPATTPDAADGRVLTPVPPEPAFDAAEFDELGEMIGQDGVMEMVEIFETETRHRLQRLADGSRDATTLVREMHTLNGAAGTVAAPRLAALGRVLEQAANGGGIPTPEDLRAIEDALDAFLTEARFRSRSRFVIR